MDNNNLSTEALKEIAGIMARILKGQINPNSIYRKQEFTSFGQHSNLLNTNVGISYYHNEDRFHGNLDGGGHFSGSISNNTINIICSQTSNSTSVSF